MVPMIVFKRVLTSCPVQVNRILSDAMTHRRMEPQAAFIRSYRAVHLDPEPSVDTGLPLIVFPWNAKRKGSFRLYQPLQNRLGPVLCVLVTSE